MSNIKSTEESAVRFAKLMAELYYHMAKEMVDHVLYGAFGVKMERPICLAKGWRLIISNFLIHYLKGMEEYDV